MPSSYAKCPTCKMWTWLDHHACPPEWQWRCEHRHESDEWEAVRARDAESAAVKAAEAYDEDDHPLFRTYNSSVVLMIRDPHTGEVSKWEARAEAVPHYYVNRV